MPVSNIIASTDQDSLISLNYDATGKVSVDLWENTIFGWGVDFADTNHPIPLIVGSLPLSPPDTSPIISPQWVWSRARNDILIAPDLWRGNAAQFFVWLATNNGAKRVLRNYTVSLIKAWDHFKRENPTLAGN